uniref:deaminase n=1 Tax=Pseudomonas urethralis TaxID=2740517 RepID=UPI0035311200
AGNDRRRGSTLSVTLEACRMCAGLSVHWRVVRGGFGALEPQEGIGQSQVQVLGQGFLNHRVVVEGGVLAQECGQILSDVFKARGAKA